MGTAEPQPRKLTPFVFLWARTVPCPNPQCRAVVPLYRQTWLRKKTSGYVALRPVPRRSRGRVDFSVVEAPVPNHLGFDPSEGMRGTATKCLCCGSAVSAKYVRGHGSEKGFGQQLLCVICVNPFGPGKLYFIDDSWVDDEERRQSAAADRAAALERELRVTTIDADHPADWQCGSWRPARAISMASSGFATPTRRGSALCSWSGSGRSASPTERCWISGMAGGRAEAITVYLALWMSRLTDRFNALARWDNTRETVQSLTSMKRVAMTWDYPEVNVFAGSSGSWQSALDYVTAVIDREASAGRPATVLRGSATRLATAGLAECEL